MSIISEVGRIKIPRDIDQWSIFKSGAQLLMYGWREWFYHSNTSMIPQHPTPTIHITGLPHHTLNDILYLFPTFSWLYDPHFLPILHKIVWNRFTYREYIKILDTRGYSFLTIWFCLWSNIMFIVLMNWVFQHLWKHEIPYLFLTFWPISQPFLTLSANSLPFQGLKKKKSWFLTFSRFSLPVGTLELIMITAQIWTIYMI